MAPQMIAGERPILTARQHPLVLVPPMVGGIIAFAVGFVVISFIPDELAGHHVGGFRPLLDLVLILAIGGAIAGSWLRWRYQNFLLTDHRIVVSRGVLARVTESIALDRVQDIRVRQTLSGRLIDCGDLEIESAGREGSEVLAFIPEPQEFANQLIAAVEAHRLGQFTPQPAGPPPSQPPLPAPVSPTLGQMPVSGWVAGETAGDRFRRGDGTAPLAPRSAMIDPAGPERPPAGPPEPPIDIDAIAPPDQAPPRWRPPNRPGGV